MREIKINRLGLENFKCHSRLELRFDGRSVSIYGDNATGKTSIYDGLTWLLFGKDSQGNGEKNIDIKPLDRSGEVKDHQAITAVEAEFAADGEVITLRRTYREIWTTRRGSSEAVYDGNTSDYFVDGVPCKKNAFDAKVRELVPEDLFRMLTSVSYFASDMKWQERRAVLFDMAGTMTDKQIMAKEERFAPLLDSMGKLSLEDYKRKLQSRKKGLTGVRDDAPTRINECQRLLQELEGIDFDGARENEKQLLARREELSARLIGLEQNTELESKRLELRGLKLDRDTLESQNRAYKDSQKRSGPDLNYLRKQLSGEQSRIATLKMLCDNTHAGLQRIDKEIQRNRELWVQVNGEAFAGGICPTCGQALPFEQLKAATADFEEKKKQRLSSIESTASRLKEEREQGVLRLAELTEEEAERNERIEQLEEAIRRNQTVTVMDMEGYGEAIAAINEKINAVQLEVAKLTSDTAQVRESIRCELSAVNDRLRLTQGLLAKEAVKEQTVKRIRELKEDAQNAAEVLESIESMLFAMEEFVRYKARFVESSINDLFRLASFRLFREQANGGLEERCDAQYGGVPFLGLNNGMRVNVGIDIINALSRHYGVRVPLFVDNAEAVTRLEDCDTQVIRLVVSREDPVLRMV